VLVKRSERHYTTNVSLGRNESLQFTSHDHAATAAATGLFDVWASAVLTLCRRVASGGLQRRGFAELLQPVARQALKKGSPVTVVVLLIVKAHRRRD
jgi:hypothetical protein